MKFFWASLCFWYFAALPQISSGRLSSAETRILFQIQKNLEYPDVLKNWSSLTNFCQLPSYPSLSILCSDNHITDLTVVGNKTKTLSENFSIDSVFTDLTKLSYLKSVSLVSLGIWGLLPPKIKRLSAMETLDLSSNFIDGNIPSSISSFMSLKTLILANNSFNGSVPDLKSLSTLEELDLSFNRLGPEFPSLSSAISTLILKNNSFRAQIPSNFNKTQRFDISFNRFFGAVPSSLFSLPSLQFLNLAHNELNGLISANLSCSKELKFIDISNNFFTGKLPDCISSASSNRTVITSWNCLSSGDSKLQHPASFCQKEAMAVKPPPKDQTPETGHKLGLMLGVIGGVIVLAGLALLVLFLIIRRRRRGGSEKKNLSVADKLSFRSSPLPPINEPRRVAQTMRITALGLPPYRVFTLEEIEESTNNFDPLNFVGEGSQEQLYKGWLGDGSLVLIKSLKLKSKHSPVFMGQHIEVLPKLRHRHLVSVLGHCIVTYQDHPNTAATLFVVIEMVSNGSLRDHLTDWRKKEMLKWPQRMVISIGVARGIQFLHSGVAPPILGNGLKIENVLLDDTLTAKISNYFIPLPFNGLEEPSRNQNAEKEDVYQFGVVLLEVITGKPITSTSEITELRNQLDKNLMEPALKLRGLIDPSIHGSFAYESLKTAVQITINCLSKDPNKRPSIEDVLWNLQYSMQVQEGWTSSGNLSMQI